jgi:hypothetical protein
MTLHFILYGLIIGIIFGEEYWAVSFSLSSPLYQTLIFDMFRYFIWIFNCHRCVTLLVYRSVDVLMMKYVSQSSSFTDVSSASLPLVASVEGFQRFPLTVCRCQLGRSGKQSARINCRAAAATFHVCHPREFTFLYSSIALLHIHFNLFFFIISSYFSDVLTLWQKRALKVYGLEQARHSGRFLKLLRSSPRVFSHPSTWYFMW